MSLIEVLPLVLACLVGGLLASVHRGDGFLQILLWYLFGHLVTMVGLWTLGRLLDVRRWFLTDLPTCDNGCCKRNSDYTYIGLGDVTIGGMFRCKCGIRYLFDGYTMKRFLPSGESELVAVRDESHFFIRWKYVKNVASSKVETSPSDACNLGERNDA